MMLKVIVNASIYDEKMKQKAMKVVSELKGIESITADKNIGKMTVIGEIDPIAIVDKLNSYNSWPSKNWPHACLDSVGPKEEKKPDEKKEEKKEEKEKTPEEKQKEEEEKKKENYEAIFRNYQYIYPNRTQNYYVQSIEEDPNACVIS